MRCSLFFSALGLGIGAIAAQTLEARATPLTESFNGSVLIQRGRERFVPTPQQTSIGNRDILYVGDDSRLVILCTPDVPSSRRSISGPGRSGIRAICDESRSINRDFCTTASEFIEGRDPEIPYIITPRNGTVLGSEILGSKILFSWNPVAQAKTYTVRLEKLSVPIAAETIWTTTTAETQLIYPNEIPLAPNTPYTLTVETDSGTSSIEGSASDSFSRSFTITNEAEDVEESLANIQTQPLSEEEALLARVTAYTCRDRPLVANAINDLEMALLNGTPSTVLFQTLGDLYYSSGLAYLAEQRYLQAIKAADLTVDLDLWMAAQEGIARVYSRTDRTELAIHYLQQAELGAYYTCDRPALERIAEFLNVLTKAQRASVEGKVPETAAANNATASDTVVTPLSCDFPTSDLINP